MQQLFLFKQRKSSLLDTESFWNTKLSYDKPHLESPYTSMATTHEIRCTRDTIAYFRGVQQRRYQIICPGGAMVRETANIGGPEAKGGGCRKGTMVSVAERLRLPDGTMRLRVVDPSGNVGWISEKDHIVRREVSNFGNLLRGYCVLSQTHNRRAHPLLSLRCKRFRGV